MGGGAGREGNMGVSGGDRKADQVNLVGDLAGGQYNIEQEVNTVGYGTGDIGG